MAARRAIVTGGFGALGRVVAAAFAARGDQVARIDVDAAPSETTAEVLDLGGVDLTDAAAVGAAVGRVTQAFGGLDTLVNIAGGFTFETFHDGSLDTWGKMHARNLVTNATITKAALSTLKQSPDARIINLGAAAAQQAGAGMGAYAASKAGVHRLTESLAAELAADDITVNAILPSIIDTPANRADMPKADFSQWVPAQAIADVILFLASPASRAITGALIPVTRGGPKAKG
jgi:NAD(P)-dependent dehydrogenase (short-subunit alcohol dehydrogenase family)